MREGIPPEGAGAQKTLTTTPPSSTGGGHTVAGKGHHTINPFRSIRGRLLLFSLCISLIPIAIITTVYYLTARNTLKKQTIELLTAVAESRKAHLLEFIEGRKGMAEVHSAEIRGQKSLIHALEKVKHGEPVGKDIFIAHSRHLKKEAEQLSHTLTMVIIDMNGVVVAATHEAMIGRDVSGNETFIKGSKGTNVELYRSSPYLEGAGCICISTPITSEESGETVGVLSIVYNLTVLNEITAIRAGMGETGEIVLGRREGDNIVFLNSLRYAPDAPLSLSVPLGTGEAEPMELALKRSGGAVIATDYRGVDVLAAYQYIPSMDWGLVAKIDTSEAFAPLRTLGIVALIVGPVSAAAVTAVGIVFAFSTSRPIRRLTDAMKRFAGGDRAGCVWENRRLVPP
ncbi:MAG: cache domain-containing protein, partial [Planctomycetota bacterium]